MASRMAWPVLLGKWHRWAGLVAAAWLLVLALTGVMLLNRQGWDWLWTSGVAQNEQVLSRDDKFLWRHHQVDPELGRVRVMSGAAGAFLSEDGGLHWRRIAFGNRERLNVQALEASGSGTDWTVLAGTDDGVWRLDRRARRFISIGLAGKSVNSLSLGATELVAAVGSSAVFVDSSKGGGEWRQLSLGALPETAGAARLELGRWFQDVHVGRGLFGMPVDFLLWNAVGFALLLLSVTGVLHWLLLRRQRKPAGRRNARLQRIIVWLFRGHAMVLGIGAALPLLLIFLTGIYQDHRAGLQQTLRGWALPAVMVPPAYRGRSWRGQIANIASGQDGMGPFLAIGNRRGMFVSRDRGAHWVREKALQGPVMRIRQVDGVLYVPGRMTRKIQARVDGKWRVLEASPTVVMVNELSAGPGGSLWWTRGKSIVWTSSQGGAIGRGEQRMPRLGYVPWASVAARVHDGALFSAYWKWVNDFVAVLGVLLVVTGFLRWRRRRW